MIDAMAPRGLQSPNEPDYGWRPLQQPGHRATGLGRCRCVSLPLEREGLGELQ